MSHLAVGVVAAVRTTDRARSPGSRDDDDVRSGCTRVAIAHSRAPVSNTSTSASTTTTRLSDGCAPSAAMPALRACPGRGSRRATAACSQLHPPGVSATWCRQGTAFETARWIRGSCGVPIRSWCSLPPGTMVCRKARSGRRRMRLTVKVGWVAHAVERAVRSRTALVGEARARFMGARSRSRCPRAR
jgi:hypothetical protein